MIRKGRYKRTLTWRWSFWVSVLIKCQPSKLELMCCEQLWSHFRAWVIVSKTPLWIQNALPRLGQPGSNWPTKNQFTSDTLPDLLLQGRDSRLVWKPATVQPFVEAVVADVDRHSSAQPFALTKLVPLERSLHLSVISVFWHKNVGLKWLMDGFFLGRIPKY